MYFSMIECTAVGKNVFQYDRMYCSREECISV